MFPLVSLLIFFVFFVVLLWLVFKADKRKMDHLGHLPIEDDHSAIL